MTLFFRYGSASGQFINPSKSTFYSGAISHRRQSVISEALGFSIVKFPFVYLGTPIFKGKLIIIHLQPIADKVKSKLSAWKASLLSIAGRVELVKSCVFGKMLYSLMTYA